MNLSELLVETVGLTLVHWDPARSLACYWNGSTAFLEYRVTDGVVEQGGSWSAAKRLTTPSDALALAASHYGLSPG